jgi:hypothetical protein
MAQEEEPKQVPLKAKQLVVILRLIAFYRKSPTNLDVQVPARLAAQLRDLDDLVENAIRSSP